MTKQFIINGTKSFIKQGIFGAYASKDQALVAAAQIMTRLSQDNYDALKVQQAWDRMTANGHSGFGTGMTITAVVTGDDPQITNNGFPLPLEAQEVYYDPEQQECF